MTDYSALMASVRGAPDEDTPRLILADWLEEAGSHGWAAFIRIGIEAARAGANGPQVLAEEKRLWRECKDARWCYPFEGDLSWMRRGLTEFMKCEWADWLKIGQKTEHPVRRVELTTWPEEMEGVDPGTYVVGYQDRDWRRMECPKCVDWHLNRRVHECSCNGAPLDEWQCDQWPQVVFVMPRAEPIGVVERVNDDGTVNVRLGQRLDAADDAARERAAAERAERAYYAS